MLKISDAYHTYYATLSWKHVLGTTKRIVDEIRHVIQYHNSSTIPPGR